MDLDPREDLKVDLNLDRMMDLAQAMAVPRDTRVDPARREDPILRDIRDLDLMTVPREAVMVPREAPNPALNLVPNLDLMTVKMEEAMEVAMAVELAPLICPFREVVMTMTMTATPTR